MSISRCSFKSLVEVKSLSSLPEVDRGPGLETIWAANTRVSPLHDSLGCKKDSMGDKELSVRLSLAPADVRDSSPNLMVFCVRTSLKGRCNGELLTQQRCSSHLSVPGVSEASNKVPNLGLHHFQRRLCSGRQTHGDCTFEIYAITPIQHIPCS